MKNQSGRVFRVSATLSMAFAFAACAADSSSEAHEEGGEGTAGELHAPEAPALGGAMGQVEGAAAESREGREAGHAEGREGGGEHGAAGEGEGEHGAGGEAGGDEGEEGGTYIAAGATWNEVRLGVRLILTFNREANAFVGTAQNTTAATNCAVRVEVHLQGGPELGPTAQLDVPAGQSVPIRLATEGAAVANWTAHPVMSACN